MPRSCEHCSAHRWEFQLAAQTCRVDRRPIRASPRSTRRSWRATGRRPLDAAKELLAALQKEKPPQPQLLNQARMSMAVAGMLAGDLDAAEKALLAINPKALGELDKEQYTELRDLLKNCRQEAFSSAFAADTDTDSKVKDKGKTAAEEARKLVEFLQKTDPGNASEIAEAKLKWANALLMGKHYHLAEKALKGIHEKQLAPDGKEYLDGIRQEIHAQQIDALAGSYDYDMRHKRYKDAVSNATAMVNNLTQVFPGQ